MIPVVCATVIAVVSEEPRGRALAIAIALAAIACGLAFHARELVFGRMANDGGPNDLARRDTNALPSRG
jgi:hypothetical protein